MATAASSQNRSRFGMLSKFLHFVRYVTCVGLGLAFCCCRVARRGGITAIKNNPVICRGVSLLADENV